MLGSWRKTVEENLRWREAMSPRRSLKNFFLILDDAVAAEFRFEVVEEFLVAGEEAGVEEGGAGDWVEAGFLDALGGGARGVSDFEAHVPEDVEDTVHDFAEGLGEFVGGMGEEEEEVEVGARVEEAAAVPAVGDEGDFAGVVLFGEGGGEEGDENVVEESGAQGGDFGAAASGVVLVENGLFARIRGSSSRRRGARRGRASRCGRARGRFWRWRRGN